MPDGVPAVISTIELARLQSAYPILALKPLTSQEEQLVLYRSRGLSSSAASIAAGYVPQDGELLLATPELTVMVEYLHACNNREVTITQDMLNVMLLEAHRKSATATEEIMAVRELGKLNDLYPSEKKQIHVTAAEVPTTRQIEKMSDHELMQVAGDIIDLDPEEYEYLPAPIETPVETSLSAEIEDAEITEIG